MSRANRNPGNLDQIFSLLDDALLEALRDTQDDGIARHVHLLRISGGALMVLAWLCLVAMTFPVVERSSLGMVMLFCAAITLLFCGGVLIDRASVRDLHAHRAGLSPLASILHDGDPTIRLPSISRRRHFGLALLLLSGFCGCAVCVPLPGKHQVDPVIWSGFAITLASLGTWQLRLAYRAALVTNTMAGAAQKRDAARTARPLSRVK